MIQLNLDAGGSIALTIVIVNYNGKDYVTGCLESIKKHVTLEYEVILVDNASTDGSSQHIRKHFPDVRLLSNDRNLGFAGGNNLGANHARGKYLLLLNNDTILLNDLMPAIKLMELDQSIGVIGMRMLGKDREYRYSAGHFPEPWRLIRLTYLYYKRGPFRKGNFPNFPEYYPVDWVEGSFLLTPLALWAKLGGLNESYFMYIEDIDYCYRVMLTDKRVVYFTKGAYIHFGGFNPVRTEMLIKGLRKFHMYHSGWIKNILVNAVLDVGFIVRGIGYFLLSILFRASFRRAVNSINCLKRQR